MKRLIIAAMVLPLVVATACGGLSEAEQHFNKSLELTAEGLWEEAIQELDKAIEPDPNYAEVYNNRAAGLIITQAADCIGHSIPVLAVCISSWRPGFSLAPASGGRGSALGTVARPPEGLQSETADS